jgi:hypothetical protein
MTKELKEVSRIDMNINTVTVDFIGYAYNAHLKRGFDCAFVLDGDKKEVIVFNSEAK